MNTENVSQRTRFEIFKRDKFTCIYCGRKPPEITLELDHVIPRSDDGSNSPTNLATSCFECNRGKSNVPLSEIPYTHKATIEERTEKLEQLKAMAQLCCDEREQTEKEVEFLSDVWIKMSELPEDYFVPKQTETAFRTFLKRLPLSEVADAIEVAFNKVQHKSDYAIFKFFCGVCWRKIKGPPKQ